MEPLPSNPPKNLSPTILSRWHSVLQCLVCHDICRCPHGSSIHWHLSTSHTNLTAWSNADPQRDPYQDLLNPSIDESTIHSVRLLTFTYCLTDCQTCQQLSGNSFICDAITCSTGACFKCAASHILNHLHPLQWSECGPDHVQIKPFLLSAEFT